MGNITKAEREARRIAASAHVQDAPAADLVVVPAVDDGLVEVSNGIETMRIHPATLKSHEAAGWKAA